jgi:hypothetical protein
MDLNKCNCGCEDCLEKTIPTNLVYTTNIKRPYIYLDKDSNCDAVLMSASLLIGSDTEPFQYHYNTVHDEDTGISGTDWKPLEDITIPIYPVPKNTKIYGSINTDVNTSEIYKLKNYDLNNYFIYDWYLTGPANFGESLNTNIESLNSGKEISIYFSDYGIVELKLIISNICGCSREIIMNIYTGTKTSKFMVVNHPYF